MAKKKFYAVKVGRNKGIYETWAECKEQVDGFPGAEYKSFSTIEEAENFIGSTDTLTKGDNGKSNVEIDAFINGIDESTLVAFVDGSYDASSQAYGYGVVLINKDKDIEKITGSDNDKDYVESRNVAGEIEGVKTAITHAVGKGYEKVVIFYDYEGIEKWATGSWNAKVATSKEYVHFIRDMERCIDIEFNKVKAHSGIEYNELADELAKKSLLRRGIKNSSDGCVTITGIDGEEFESIFELLKMNNEGLKVGKAGESKSSTNHILSLEKDKIVVTCFKKGTTTIQGKQSPLLEKLMILVVELLPSNGEVVEILNDYHDISIPQDDLTLRFNELLPNFDKNKTNLQKLINTLNQAVYNTMLKGERPDYSDLATPSLRANEYYLYKILQDRGIMQESSDKYGFGIFFKENTEGVYEIKQKHEDKLLSEEKTFINELYNFYYNNRHTLLHFDKEPKLTRVLKSMEEARSLIISNLELIDKYYTVF
ncbi:MULTISPECIES: viroplasmin family protein [Bacillus]|uniref:Ribonuclease H n=1 Tax=Bacillus cereus TaxID=1396 RepID=A0A150AXN3_BACCE|nr:MULTISPECIES: viroplasmin family protein [Bacillus]KXX88335.1 hypothetical protein AT274_09630 [Bacillus cereus]MCG3790972.1 viroplasmin family protein [Bacillus sp. UTDS19-33BHI26]RSC62950.1 reverse transcriptase-like protein [Bacillus sp. (in: firmicutes)]HDX9541509.1 type II toxin-antitoxin system RnlA family toxin [Bacillus thuringiensis]